MLERKHRGYPKFKKALVGYLAKRDEFLRDIWNKRLHLCAVTNQNLGSEPNSMYFHHILPKSKYPQFEFNEENIVLLHPHIHASVELDMYKYEEINKLREAFRKKYME